MQMPIATVCLLLGVMQLVAAGCDVDCTKDTTETACMTTALTTCQGCSWDRDSRKCSNEPTSTCDAATCSTCRAQGTSGCPVAQGQPACERVNSDECIICAWSSGKCKASTCTKACKYYKSQLACNSANNGACPYTCTWSSIDNECDGVANVIADAVEEGMKLFVIIVIVVCVIVVLVIVGCIVCCCCMGASAMSSTNKTVVVENQQQQPAYQQHQEMGRL
eukprot:TRINITY_DN295_c7_g1_i1.p1 TRINITY_DN295_c7_g1~~TRINITY_DN295_c7_g1_i1.p1  ORF type:complete len:221 (+),score=64.88 TRINITY_DN295_c7_g1_i1:64-726(+)